MKRLIRSAATALVVLLSGQAKADDELLIYSWADYIPPTVIAAFEAETGIKVDITPYESVEIPETKLLTGGSGFDLVITAGFTVPRLIEAGALRPFDRAKLTNFGNLDPVFVGEKLQKLDPGTRYALPYAWGTTGIGFDRAKVQERLGPDAPFDSLALLLDPKNAERLADCGIAMVDSASDLLSVAMYLSGVKDEYHPSDEELRRGGELLRAVRPYVRYFDNVRYRQDLAEGEICAAIGWSMDVTIAEMTARGAGLPHADRITFVRPKEGSVIWADHMVIPVDAPHPEAAELFADFLMRPESAGEIVNNAPASSPNSRAMEFVIPELRGHPTVFPPADWTKAQIPLDTFDLETQRKINRYFTAIKAESAL
jgi:putrescine transport system substrate-binding protein